LIAGFEDGEIIILDIESGKNVHSLKYHKKDIVSLKYINNKLLSSCENGMVAVWDIITGKFIDAWAPHDGMSPCLETWENNLITGFGDGKLYAWDIVSRTKTDILTTPESDIKYLILDNHILFGTGKDKVIKAWDMRTKKAIRQFKGHRDDIECLTFNENILVSAGSSGVIIVWGKNTGDVIKKFKAHKDVITCLEIKDNMLVSGSWDCTIKIWNLDNFELVKTIKGADTKVECFKMINNQLLAGYKMGQILGFDLSNYETESEYLGNKFVVYEMLQYKHLLISYGEDQSIRVWDHTEDAKPGKTFRFDSGVREIGIYNKCFYTATHYQSVWKWNLVSGELDPHPRPFKQISWDNVSVFHKNVFFTDKPHLLYERDIETGKIKRTYEGNFKDYGSLIVTEEKIIYVQNYPIRVIGWDRASGKRKKITIAGDTDSLLAFTDTGYLVSDKKNYIHVIDTFTKERIFTQKVNGDLFFADLSEKYVVFEKDGNICCWNFRENRLCFEVPLSINEVIFYGDYLIASDKDTAIYIFDIMAGRQLGKVYIDEWISAFKFDEESMKLVVGGLNGGVYLFQLKDTLLRRNLE
jgi:WD40 repeat protein